MKNDSIRELTKAETILFFAIVWLGTVVERYAPLLLSVRAFQASLMLYEDYLDKGYVCWL